MGLTDQEDAVDRAEQKTDRVQALREAYLAGRLSLDIPEQAPGLDRLLVELFAQKTVRVPLRCLPFPERR